MSETVEMITDILSRYDCRVLFMFLTIAIIVNVGYIFKKTNILISLTISVLCLLGIVFENNTLFGIQEWADWYLVNDEVMMNVIQENNMIMNLSLISNCLLIILQVVVCGYRTYKRKKS